MGPLARAALLVALVFGTSCGPTNPGPSGELASMLNFAAYPGGTLVSEWYSSEGGPAPMPGNYGWREYRTDDAPAAIRAHYERLARTNGWTLNPASPPPDLGTTNNQVGDLTFKGRTLHIFVSNSQGGAGQMGPYGPKPMPVEASPAGASPSPTPTPTLPPGPWYVRTEGQANYR